MLTIPVLPAAELHTNGYRRLSVVPLPRPDPGDTTLRGDTPARTAALTQLAEHYQCDIAYLAKICAPVAMTPDGYLFIQDT